QRSGNKSRSSETLPSFASFRAKSTFPGREGVEILPRIILGARNPAADHIGNTDQKPFPPGEGGAALPSGRAGRGPSGQKAVNQSIIDLKVHPMQKGFN